MSNFLFEKHIICVEIYCAFSQTTKHFLNPHYIENLSLSFFWSTVQSLYSSSLISVKWMPQEWDNMTLHLNSPLPKRVQRSLKLQVIKPPGSCELAECVTPARQSWVFAKRQVPGVAVLGDQVPRFIFSITLPILHKGKRWCVSG